MSARIVLLIALLMAVWPSVVAAADVPDCGTDSCCCAPPEDPGLDDGGCPCVDPATPWPPRPTERSEVVDAGPGGWSIGDTVALPCAAEGARRVDPASPLLPRLAVRTLYGVRLI